MVAYSYSCSCTMACCGCYSQGMDLTATVMGGNRIVIVVTSFRPEPAVVIRPRRLAGPPPRSRNQPQPRQRRAKINVRSPVRARARGHHPGHSPRRLHAGA